MDFNAMLQFLSSLLTNKQSTQASQWGQGLGFSQQQLAQQGTQFGQNLAQQGSQFTQSLAQLTDAQNQAMALKQQQQQQAEQAQAYAQEQQTRTTSLPYLNLMAMLQRVSSPAGQQASQSFLNDFHSRVTEPTWKRNNWPSPTVAGSYTIA